MKLSVGPLLTGIVVVLCLQIRWDTHEYSRSRRPVDSYDVYLSDKCLLLAVKFTVFVKVAMNEVSKMDGWLKFRRNVK